MQRKIGKKKVKEMVNEILNMALGNGIWAALFCLLFFYQLKDSRNREKSYLSAIDGLMSRLEDLKFVEAKCMEIKEDTEMIIAKLKKGGAKEKGLHAEVLCEHQGVVAANVG
jgi:hypothetical protein